MFQLCVTVGILLAQVTTFYTSPLGYGWRLALAMGGAPGLLLTLGALLLPETPEFLLSKGRREEALAVTRRAYGVQDVDAAVSRRTEGSGAEGMSGRGVVTIQSVQRGGPYG